MAAGMAQQGVESIRRVAGLSLADREAKAPLGEQPVEFDPEAAELAVHYLSRGVSGLDHFELAKAAFQLAYLARMGVEFEVQDEAKTIQFLFEKAAECLKTLTDMDLPAARDLQPILLTELRLLTGKDPTDGPTDELPATLNLPCLKGPLSFKNLVTQIKDAVPPEELDAAELDAANLQLAELA